MWFDFINTVLSQLFPTSCFGCGKFGERLCHGCVIKNLAVDKRVLEIISPRRETTIPLPIYSLFAYQSPTIRKTLQHLKYRGEHAVAKLLGKLLYDNLLETLAEEAMYFGNWPGPWLVAPIPLSRIRARKRGFNQAEKIARAFIAASQGETAGAKQLKLALIFNRIKEVSPQVKTKNRKERFVNMENSFAVKQVVEIKNALVIVVDDIVTTGATLSAAATALYNAGAGKVVGLTIAHTLEKQQISDKLGQV